MQFSLLAPLLIVITSTTAGPGTPASRQLAANGSASGIWELPGGTGGFTVGTLYSVDGRSSLYELQAGLLPVVVGRCNACAAGAIAGTLDDGIGTGPDFAVDGLYVAVLVYGVGVGAFEAALRPTSGASAGVMRGFFLDPNASGTPTGAFQARYDLGP